LIGSFDRLLEDAFGGSAHFNNIRDLAYGIFNCHGRATITGFITGACKQFVDWSAYYRLFSKERLDVGNVFNKIFKRGVELSPKSKYVVVHMDDTVLKKTGKKIPGTSWRRDPLGPPFQTNLIWGQRFIELSLAIPMQKGIGPSRAVPIQFSHCPSAKKPKSSSSDQEHKNYKEELKQKNLNAYGNKEIRKIRSYMNENGMEDKRLVLCVDGSYTNGSVLKDIPDNVSFIGRTRKDGKFHYPAVNSTGPGRNKVYGEQLPTPDEIRKSDNYKWHKINAWAAGKNHEFNIKVVEGFIWRKTGGEQKYRLIVIRPLSYRLSKKSKLLYRAPAYLLCTDFEMSLQDTLQFYLWRWEIEVNIGEGKSQFGVGQANVRNQKSVETVPAFITTIYSLLLLANLESSKSNQALCLPRPKWYPHKPNKRITTGDLINKLKAQIYCNGIGIHFSHFVNMNNKLRSGRNDSVPLIYSSFYGRA